MSPPHGERQNGELDEALLDFPEAERGEYQSVAARLRARPLPPPQLRATIRSEISARGSQPQASLRLAFGYISCGGLLLTLVALGLAGLGPLSA
jgi:hypothetical protein